MPVSIRTLLLLICLSGLVSKPAFSQNPVFGNGDNVCFIGNSITMSGTFHHYIQLYYATRFPKARVSFFNCGISGEVAGNMLNRLDEDVLVHQPDWCMVMAGSNDINGELYSEANKNLPDLEKLKQDALNRYYENTTLLVTRLLEKKTRVMLEIPCIYDQTGKLRGENEFGANDALYKCGIFLKELAKKHHLQLVDYWAITADINRRVQMKNDSATIIGQDRSHPNNYGNFIMAYQFLHTQLGGGKVSELTIDAANKKMVKVLAGKPDHLKVTANSVSFNYLEDALPFPSPDNIVLDSLIPFVSQFNTEILRIRGLASGVYALTIDAVPVGKFTGADFAKGLDLSGNSKTPQYRQADSVLAVLDKYWAVVADQRAVKYVEYQHLRNLKNRQDMDVVSRFFDSALVRHKSSDNYNFFKKMFGKYLLMKPQEPKLTGELSVLADQIDKLNKPRSHFFRIVKIK